MRRSKVEMYAHLVWTTKGRQERLTPEFERQVHRCIISEAELLKCIVLATGGMPDHVHLVVRTPGKVSPSLLAKQVKAVSSRMMNGLRAEFTEIFDWQDGYASFSLGRTQVAAVVAYVKNQKQHHTQGTIWPEWEETDEEAPNTQ